MHCVIFMCIFIVYIDGFARQLNFVRDAKCMGIFDIILGTEVKTYCSSSCCFRTHTIQHLWLHVVQALVWLQQRSEAWPRILCVFLLPSVIIGLLKHTDNYMINSWGEKKLRWILTSAISTLRSHSLTLFFSWPWDSLTLMYCRTCGTWKSANWPLNFLFRTSALFRSCQEKKIHIMAFGQWSTAPNSTIVF